MQANRDLMNDSDCAGKTKQGGCKSFQENSEIF